MKNMEARIIITIKLNRLFSMQNSATGKTSRFQFSYPSNAINP
jgi:hypothetical protein